MIEVVEKVVEWWNVCFDTLNEIKVYGTVGMGYVLIAFAILAMFLGVFFRVAKF